MDAGTMYANAKALHELLQEAHAENGLLTMRLNAEHIVRQNLAAENAKLRDELDLCLKQVKKCEECEAMFNCEDCEAMLDCDECLRADASQKERKRVDYENAKLRELAERAWKSAERLCQAFDGPCRDDGVTIYKPCPMGERDEECIYGQLQRELRECGVGVDA